MERIVLDIDGVIVDNFTPIEDRLHTSAMKALSTAIPADEERDLSVSDLVWLSLFSFDDCVDWQMTNFPEALRTIIKKQWGLKDYWAKNPPIMYDNSSSVPIVDAYASVPFSPRNLNRRPTKEVWARLLAFLANYVEVELHSHVYTHEIASARRIWLDDLISQDVENEITVKLDVGSTKSRSVGTLVVEDNLENLCKANCEVRVLRSLFHNVISRSNNDEIWSNAGHPLLYCYGMFYEMCDLLFLFAGQCVGKKLSAVKSAWYDYNDTLDRRGERITQEL